MGLDLDALFPERWLHAEDLKGKHWDLTIKDIYIDKDIHDVSGGKRQKSTVMSFKETGREYLLNLTNKRVLVRLWGKDTDDIIGHQITVAPVPDDFGPSGVRVAFVGSPDIDKAVKVNVGGKEKTRIVKPTGKTKPAPADDQYADEAEIPFGDDA